MNRLLYKFFSGKASDEEIRQALDWMEKTEENRKEFFQERKIYDALLLSEDKIFNETPGSLMRWTPFIGKALRIAAIFIFAFVLSYFYYSRNNKSGPVTAMNSITVPAGQRVNLTLGDGTDVWLNARTTFRYPTSFDSNVRLVYLDGEAYFNVAEDKQKPFMIDTKKYKVGVFGTQFNLLAYSGNDIFQTALMEGSVALESKTDKLRKLTLLPNQMASEKDGRLEVSTITNYDPFRWKEGLICFRDQPFNEVMYEFEKSYGIKIIINNKKVSKYTYTGKLRQSDGINHAMRTLQLSISFQFHRDDENNIIYIE
ncbi:MAG: DUF4974 domain-containing protein [Dysgonamonadaceae bacterium]|jgi:ferric-dicitrate binding protein FerR (iron transport regulator)|nr:DUF4974 domain-containing protein [Dysgonamonadaceae bacterium]